MVGVYITTTKTTFLPNIMLFKSLVETQNLNRKSSLLYDINNDFFNLLT